MLSNDPADSEPEPAAVPSPAHSVPAYTVKLTVPLPAPTAPVTEAESCTTEPIAAVVIVA